MAKVTESSNELPLTIQRRISPSVTVPIKRPTESTTNNVNTLLGCTFKAFMASRIEADSTIL